MDCVTWDAKLFGGFTIARRGGAPIRLRSERAEALLAYLFLHADQDISREQLAHTLWYECEDIDGKSRWDAANARVYLNNELSKLAAALGPAVDGSPPIRSERKIVRLQSRYFQTDLGEFHRQLDAAHTDNIESRRAALRQAVEIAETGGALLCTLYDDWAIEARKSEQNALESARRQLRAATPAPQHIRTPGEDMRLAQLDFCRGLLRKADSSLSTQKHESLKELEEWRWLLQASAYQEARMDEMPALLASQALLSLWQSSSDARSIRDILIGWLERGEVAEFPKPYVHALVGKLSLRVREFSVAEKHLRTAFAIFKARRDRGAMAGTLANLACVALQRHDSVSARQISSETLKIIRELGEPDAVCLNLLGCAESEALSGDRAAALARLHEAWQIASGMRNPMLKIRCYTEGAWILARQGRFAEAKGYAARGLDIAQKSNIVAEAEDARKIAGIVSESEGDFAAATRWYCSCLPILCQGADELAFLARVQWVLCTCAHIPSQDSQSIHAPRLLQTNGALTDLSELAGLESRLRKRFNPAASRVMEHNMTAIRAALRDALGRARFYAAYERGRTMSIAEAAQVAQRL